MDGDSLSPDGESKVDYLNTPDGGSVGGPADAASFDAGRAKEQFGAGGTSAKDRRPTVEIPQRVAVGEYYGQSWKGPVKADILTHRRQADRSYGLLDLSPGATHIAMRMSNGDIIMLLAAYPEESENERRDYRMTSVLMNQGIQPGEDLRTLDVPYEGVNGLVIEPQQQLKVRTVRGIQVSDGVVDEVITYDRTKPVKPHDKGKLPESTISKDFLAQLGR